MATRYKVLILLVLAAGIYGLVPQIGGFGNALHIMSQAQLVWLVTAVLMAASSYVWAAGVYQALAKRHLKLGATSVVQLASNFTNRLVPAGIGALAVNYRYLRQTKHTEGQASAIILLNNLLGFVGNMLLLVLFVLFTAVRPRHLTGPSWLVAVIILGVIVAAAIGWHFFKRRLKPFLKAFLAALRSYRRQSQRLLAALAISIILTLSYALCLWACCQAVHLTLSLGAIFISMSLGVAGATVTPTPGGLGGAEAALVAALVVYGANRPAALAAVLLYRLCTFWLPLALGGFAVLYARRHKYI